MEKEIKWLDDVKNGIVKKSANFLDNKLKFEFDAIGESGTDGWCFRSKMDTYKSVYVELWYDSFTTRNTREKRLYFGFSMNENQYKKLSIDTTIRDYKLTDVDYEIAGKGKKTPELRPGQEYLRELGVKKVKVRLNEVVTESYEKENTYWLGTYFDHVNPHKNKKADKIIQQALNFFSDVLDGDYFINLERKSKKTSQEIKVVEGIMKETRTLYLTRNIKVVRDAIERDKNTCRACKYKFEINGKHIVEGHHINPIHMGKRVTTKKDIITLCPSCHRIAHSGRGSMPLPFEKLKQIVPKFGF